MKIFVVDADPMFCGCVSNLLRQQGDFEVVGQAQNGTEAVVQAQALRPDIVLMNVQLPGIDGLQAARQIKAVLPEVKLVMCTSLEQSDEFFQAVQVGVDGYLPKQIEPSGLYRSLKEVYHGETAITRSATTWLFEAFSRLAEDHPDASGPPDQLSPRERELLELLTTGARNKEIASRLNISENTVKSHLKNVLAKLGLKNRQQAVTYALRNGKGHTHGAHPTKTVQPGR